jgi:putrescine aminotransferase
LVAFLSRHACGQWLAVKLLEQGIICQPAGHHWNVLKLTPPLTITTTGINTAINTIVDVINQYQSLAALVRDMSARLLRRDKTDLMY